MAEWLEQVSQWHEMYCHNLEVMSSNPCRVKLGVCSTSVLSRTWTKNKNKLMVPRMEFQIVWTKKNYTHLK